MKEKEVAFITKLAFIISIIALLISLSDLF